MLIESEQTGGIFTSFEEKPEFANPVVPALDYFRNDEVFVSVRRRNKRRFEEVGNYSISIGVEMLNPEVWDDFKLFWEINDFDWNYNFIIPQKLMTVILGNLPGLSDIMDKVESFATGAIETVINGAMDIIFFNDNSIVNLLGFDGKGMFKDDPSYNAIGNFIQFSGLFGEDSIVRLMVDKIEVDCQRSDDSWDVIQGDGDQIFHFKNSKHSIGIPWDEYFLGSAVVKITAMDEGGTRRFRPPDDPRGVVKGVGNKASMEEEWYGVVQTMWNEFMTFMREMWEKGVAMALKYGNVIYEWVKGEIEKRWGGYIGTIMAGVEGYIKGIMTSMQEFFTQINDFEWSGTHTMPDDFKVESETDEVMEAGIALMMSFLGLQSQADKLMNGLKIIMDFIEPFSSLLDPMKVMEIIGRSSPVIEESFSFISTILHSGMEIVIENLLDFVFLSENSILEKIGFGYLIDLQSLQLNAILNYVKYSGIFAENSMSMIAVEYILESQEEPETRDLADDVYNGLNWLAFFVAVLGFYDSLANPNFLKFGQTNNRVIPGAENSPSAKRIDFVSSFFSGIGLFLSFCGFFFESFSLIQIGLVLGLTGQALLIKKGLMGQPIFFPEEIIGLSGWLLPIIQAIAYKCKYGG